MFLAFGSNYFFNLILFRDCWGLKLTLNEDDLYRTESKYFRPDLFLSKIYLENIVEVPKFFFG